jgi:Ca-activated chloride channel family protein
LSGLQFANAWILFLLWLVPVVAVWWYFTNQRRERQLSAFMSDQMQKKLRPALAGTRFSWQLGLITAGLLLILIAVARPQWGSKEELVYQRGRDLVIALDVSRSMLANDVRPNRLQSAKADILDLLKEMQGDRAALIAFRRTAVLLCPLTTDYAYLRQALDSVDTDSAPRGETDIGDAINKAVDALGNDEGSHKAIILISDGEDLAGKAVAAAEKAGEKHIAIFTVGIGDRKGSRIPEQDGKQGFLKYNGNDVVTKLDNDALWTIAKKTGGAYLPIETAGMTSVTLGTLYRDHLAKLAERDLEETLQRRYIERYQYFLFPAFLFLLAGACLSRGRLASRRGGAAGASTAAMLMLLMAADGASGATNITAQPPVSTNEAATQTNSVPAIVVPEGREGGRLAQRFYLEGRYEDAARAYMEALKGAGERSRRDFRYNAAVALFKAGKYGEAADLMRDVTELGNNGRADALMGLGASLFKQAEASQKEEDAAQLEKREKLLRDSGEAFKGAVREESDNGPARRDLAVVLDALPDAEKQAKTARLLADYEKTQAPELAAKMLAEQRNLVEEIPQSLTNNSPERIKQLEELSRRQVANADLWIPLKGKLLNAMAAQQGSTNLQQQLATINQLAEATRDSMTTAAAKLRDLDPAGHNSAAASGAALYNIWRAIAPYQLVLQEDLLQQSNAIAGAEAVIGGDEERRKPAVQSQNITTNLTELFVQRFSAAVPEGGEAAVLAKPSDHTKGGQDLRDSTKKGQEERGISAETRQKILELAGQAKDLQANAATAVRKGDLAGALPDGQKSHELLKEIEKLLPRNENQQEQNQEKKEQQKQEQKQDKQDQKQQQDQKQDQQQSQQKQEQEQEQKSQEQPGQKKDSTPQDVKKLLEKALQREKDHEQELRRRNQQIPPSAIDRDW